MFVLFMTPYFVVFFFKQKTAYEMRISDWSSDVCSSDLKIGLNDLADRGKGGGIAHRQRQLEVAHTGFCKQRPGLLRIALRGHQGFLTMAGKAGRDDACRRGGDAEIGRLDRKSTRLNSSH